MLGILQAKKTRFLFLPVECNWLPGKYKLPFLLFLFYGLLAAIMLAPVASTTHIPNLADYLTNLAALQQAKIALLNGQFPLRFMPLEHWGWHYPFYQFYSTTTFTIAGLIYAVVTPDNPLVAFKIMLWLSLVVGGIYLQRLAFWFTQSLPAAMLAGAIYLCAPYHVIIIDYLGALNEVVALGILPAVLYYTFLHFTASRASLVFLKLAIGWYLLATTHIITFVYATCFITLLLALSTLGKPRRWRNLISVGSAYALACLLAMWYLAPIAMFHAYLNINSTFDSAAHIVSQHPLLSQLLASAATLTPGRHGDAIFTIHPALGWPILFSALISLYGYLSRSSSGARRADDWLASLLTVFFIAFFFVWSPLNIWQWLPKQLWVAQYSWRLLGQVSWMGALLSAWALCWLFKNKLDSRHVIFGTLMILASVNPWFPPTENYAIPLDKFIAKPFLIYNADAYLLRYHRFIQFVGNIDNTLVEPTKHLNTDSNYYIPKPLLQLAPAPALDLSAIIPASLGNKNYHLDVYENNRLTHTDNLSSGPLHWNISLAAATKEISTAEPLILKFMLLDNNNTVIHEPLAIERLLLTGYLDQHQVINITQTQSQCRQKHSQTVCDIEVAPGKTLIELPALYYPEMLKIFLNGNVVPYQSVVYEDELLTGIVPKAGGMNHIVIQFQGLQWANLISWMSWLLVIIMLFQHLLVAFKQRFKSSAQ